MASQTLNPLPGQRVYVSGSGSNDNDVVIDALDVREFDTFTLMSTGGAMDVEVSLDGSNYTTAPLCLADLGAQDLAPVLQTVAGRLYGFRGRFKHVRVRQNGVTAVANASLFCSVSGD